MRRLYDVPARLDSRGAALNRDRGIGLILVLLILALLSLLVAAMLTAVTVEVRIGDNYRTETQLLYLTEAGIEDGREQLKGDPILPGATPFIKDKPLLDTTGREVGRYSVTLVRADPLTLRSVGKLGASLKTIESRLRPGGVPHLAAGITLSGEGLPGGNVDPDTETPQALERIVESIRQNAGEVHVPAVGGVFNLGAVGDANDYRVVVVDGDCDLGNAEGYGVLLVRGNLTLYGTVSWKGQILAIGQGVVRAQPGTVARLSGAVFLARTRANDRSPLIPLGTLLDSRGPITLDLQFGSVSLDPSLEENERAGKQLPYVLTSYREY
jgi:PilX N-terminal